MKLKEISKYNKENSNEKNRSVSLDKAKLFDKADNKRELNIIIKSDVQGSREALKMAKLIRLPMKRLNQIQFYLILE